MATLLVIPAGPGTVAARSSLLGSLVVHSGLIALAALGTRTAPPSADVIGETPIFLPAMPRPSRPTPPGLPRVPGVPRPTLPSVFQLPATIPLPDMMPPSTPPAPWADDPWPGTPGAPGTPGDTLPALPGAHDLPLDGRVVEHPPQLRWHPSPRYPETLRQAGIEGVVVVEAVLDTLGRVEAGSTRVVRGSHVLMDAEALAVVRASRYGPGRMGSRAVRVRILVPVRFALRR